MSQWVKSPNRNSPGQFLRSRCVLLWDSAGGRTYRRYKNRKVERAK